MNKRRKFLAIVMSLVAFSGVAAKEISQAIATKNGTVEVANRRWNPSAGPSGTCENCTPTTGQTCDFTPTEHPCTCYIGNPGNTFDASTLIGLDENNSTNCVALFQQP